MFNIFIYQKKDLSFSRKQDNKDSGSFWEDSWKNFLHFEGSKCLKTRIENLRVRVHSLSSRVSSLYQVKLLDKESERSLLFFKKQYLSIKHQEKSTQNVLFRIKKGILRCDEQCWGHSMSKMNFIHVGGCIFDKGVGLLKKSLYEERWLIKAKINKLSFL